MAFLERSHEENEAWKYSLRTGPLSQSEHQEGCLTNDVKHEADEAVVGCERKQDFVHENNMLKVVYYTFSIEKVHSGPQKIPIE